MTNDPKKGDSDELSIPEKIQRVQDLWDEIARTPEQVELTPEQRDEVEQRLREHEKNPGTYSTWEEVRRRLEGSR